MKRVNFLVSDEIVRKLMELVVDNTIKTKQMHTKTSVFIEAIETLYNIKINSEPKSN